MSEKFVPPQPALTPNTRRVNVNPNRDSARVIPLRMFAAEITDHRKGDVKVYLGIEMAGQYYAFPDGKSIVNLKSMADGFTPFADEIQQQIRTQLEGAKPVDQGSGEGVPSKDTVSVL